MRNELARTGTSYEGSEMWNDLTIVEWIPICILALEAIGGVACNSVALMMYCHKNVCLKNPGNMFTVNLIVDDLILSGITTPLVLCLQITEFTSPAAINHFCMLARCAILFSAVSSAAGNTLLALDRRDIAMQPSRRFFHRRRALLAILVTWFCSTLGLVIPLFSSLSRTVLKRRDYNRTANIGQKTTDDQESQELIMRVRSVATEKYVTECTLQCYDNQCMLTRLETSLRFTFQILFFLFAVVVIFVSYYKILYSVQRRNVRYAKTIRSDVTLYTSIGKTSQSLSYLLCCECEQEKDVLLAVKATGPRSLQATNASKTSSFIQDTSENSLPREQRVNKGINVIQSITNPEKTTTKEIARPFPTKDSEIGGNGTATHDRADFATVALSVKAVMTIKRMIKERIKEKRKKIRHLRRMTILITFTFLTCWTPFHIVPLVRLFINDTTEQPSLCHLQDCPGEENETLVSNQTRKLIFPQKANAAWNVIFLWCLVFASASSVANPFFYSFSREKLRQDFHQIVCLNRKRKAKARMQAGQRRKVLSPRCTRKQNTSVLTQESEKSNASETQRKRSPPRLLQCNHNEQERAYRKNTTKYNDSYLAQSTVATAATDGKT